MNCKNVQKIIFIHSTNSPIFSRNGGNSFFHFFSLVHIFFTEWKIQKNGILRNNNNIFCVYVGLGETRLTFAIMECTTFSRFLFIFLVASIIFRVCVCPGFLEEKDTVAVFFIRESCSRREREFLWRNMERVLSNVTETTNAVSLYASFLWHLSILGVCAHK